MLTPSPIAHREPLSFVDAAWLRMDTPTNLMVITSVLVFEEPLSEAMVSEILERLLRHERFRQRVATHRSPLERAEWEDDPSFHLPYHVRRSRLPSPGGHAELQAFVSERMSTPLDRSRPLWEVDVVEGVGSGTALVTRVHHSLADGIALVRLFLDMTDDGQGLSPASVGLAADHQPRAPLAWVKHESELVRTFVRLLFLRPDPRTALRGRLTTSKRASWSKPIPLSAVHALASAQGATVNDVLVAATAGALRSYLETRGTLPPREIRALVPVYLRGSNGDVGNHFGLVFLPLPIGDSDWSTRVRKTKERMGVIKHSPEAAVAFGVLGAMGVARRAIEQLGLRLFTAKASILLTNVPGPPERVRLAGKTVSSMMVWAPTSGTMGVSVSLLSYAGDVRIGISADAALVNDPDDLVERFAQEFR